MTRLWFNDSCLPTFQFTKTILLLLLSLVECWIWLNLYVLHYWGLLLEIITRIKVSYWLNLTREVAEFQFLISCRMCGQLWQCQCTFKKYFFYRSLNVPAHLEIDKSLHWHPQASCSSRMSSLSLSLESLPWRWVLTVIWTLFCFTFVAVQAIGLSTSPQTPTKQRNSNFRRIPGQLAEY